MGILGCDYMEGCSGKDSENDIIEDGIRKENDVTVNASEKDKTRDILKNNIMDTGIDKSLWDKFVLCGVNPTLLNSYMTLINNRENKVDKSNTNTLGEHDKNNTNRNDTDVFKVKHLDLGCDKSDEALKEKKKKEIELDIQIKNNNDRNNTNPHN